MVFSNGFCKLDHLTTEQVWTTSLPDMSNIWIRTVCSKFLISLGVVNYDRLFKMCAT